MTDGRSGATTMGQPWWYPIGSADPEAIDKWVESVLGDGQRGAVTGGEARAALRRLVSAPADPDFPLRAWCQPPTGAGMLFDFAAVTADADDWPSGQVTLLSALAGASVHSESIVSDGEVHMAAILFTTHLDESEPGAIAGPVYGQVHAAVRRAAPHGQFDLVGRGVHDDPGFLELMTYPLISFLHGDDLLAAVQAE